MCNAQDQEVTKGKFLKEFDFGRNELDKAFTVKRGEWKVEDGAFSAKEIESEKHAASCHLTQPTKDAVFEFRYKLSNDGARINFGFDPVKGELERAGHLHAVTINSKVVSMSMAGDKKKPKENPATKLGRARLKLKKNTWYHVSLANTGGECRLSIDGKTLIIGKHLEIAVKKPSIIFRAFGEGISIDDIKIWEIE